jgi:hypothetical protein
MRLFKFTAIAVAIASASIMVSAQARQRNRPGQQQADAATANYTRADAETIAKRLYKAILGRDGDAQGLTVATAEIQRGSLRAQIDGMLDSNEFRNGPGRKPSAALLEQFYRGLLNRAPDTAGVQSFLPRADRGQFTEILLDMVRSNEFQGILSSPPADNPPARPNQPQMSRLEASLACQAKVIAQVREDAGGRIFLSFDRMPDVNGDTISGPAVDRFDDVGRQLTYRCAGNNVTYSYSDRRRPTVVDARLRYPSAAVRNCQDAIRGGLVFDAAGLSVSDTNNDYVIGLVGNNVRQCTMREQTVGSVT